MAIALVTKRLLAKNPSSSGRIWIFGSWSNVECGSTSAASEGGVVSGTVCENTRRNRTIIAGGNSREN